MFYELKLLLLVKVLQIVCQQSIGPVVSTTSGKVEGKTIVFNNKRVEQYLNIPYAEPPIGELRFLKPVPLRQPINGTINGTQIGNACWQLHSVYDFGVPESEDCLILNVWTVRSRLPFVSPGSPFDKLILKPVMFYIHGGNNDWGTAFESVLNGTALATHDVVVVTINYRLNLFGYLYGGDGQVPGNMGLFDQLLALKWIRNNIRNFEGDPNEITIFGESAGSWSVTAHILSPLSKGLFKRAILESGALIDNRKVPYLPPSAALNQTRLVLQFFGCPQTIVEGFQCLRRVDAHLLTSFYFFRSYDVYGTEYLPLTAQQAFKDGKYSRDIDIMAGVIKDEGSILTHWIHPEAENLHSASEWKAVIDFIVEFSLLNSTKIADFYLRNVDTNNTAALKQAFYQFYGDIFMKCPTYFFSKLFAQNTPKRNVYFYYWTYASQIIADELNCTAGMGICHQSDIAYVFGEPVLRNQSDRDFSSKIMELWTNFAKTGNPSLPVFSLPGIFHRNPVWPRLLILDQNKPTMIKELNPNTPDHIIKNLFEQNCEGFWRDYFVGNDK